MTPQEKVKIAIGSVEKYGVMLSEETTSTILTALHALEALCEESEKDGEGILPCPFCGGEAHIIKEITMSGCWFSIMCDNYKNFTCCARGVIYTSREAAIKQWNTRTGKAEQIAKEFMEDDKP